MVNARCANLTDMQAAELKQTKQDLSIAHQQLAALQDQLSALQQPRPFQVQRHDPFQDPGQYFQDESLFASEFDDSYSLSLGSPDDYDEQSQAFRPPLTIGPPEPARVVQPTSIPQRGTFGLPAFIPTSGLRFDQPAEVPRGQPVTVFRDINQAAAPVITLEKRLGCSRNVTQAWINEHIIDNRRILEMLSDFGHANPNCKEHMDPLPAAIGGLEHKKDDELPAARAAVTLVFKEFYKKLSQPLRLLFKQTLDPTAQVQKRQKANQTPS